MVQADGTTQDPAAAQHLHADPVTNHSMCTRVRPDSSSALGQTLPHQLMVHRRQLLSHTLAMEQLAGQGAGAGILWLPL